MTCLIYVSPLPWNSFAQRPHKFVEWFHARHAGPVLWIDPYPTRLPAWEDVRRLRSRMGSAHATPRPLPPWLTVLPAPAFPIEPLPGSGVVNGFLWRRIHQAVERFSAAGQCLLAFGKPSKLALQLMHRHPQLTTLFDIMDDFPEFYRGISRFAMERSERAVAAQVEQVLVSSTLLARRFAACGPRLNMALNACAIETLPPVKNLPARPASPMLGYVGTIAQWFDWDLVLALAAAHPSVPVRLIGPVFGAIPESLPGNIELLPACQHQQAINHMQEFSVGLIPFKRTALTASVDPIKYYEYRALGLPVLSTRFGEMAMREDQPGVFLAEQNSNLQQLVEQALVYRDTPDAVQAFRGQHSWEARFDAAGISF
nr:glycosyl transferase [uncultured Janthinobacterium sp.]